MSIRFAEIYEGKVLSVGISDIFPVLSPPLVVVDITDYDGEVKEGYIYKDGVFIEDTTTTPEPEPEPPVEQPETIEEKIVKWMISSDQNSLIMVDSILGVYEELTSLREELELTKEALQNIKNGGM